MNKKIQNRWNRPAIRRMAYIRRKIMTGKPFNASTIARELECCTKTVHRDIEFMRDNLGYEFEFDEQKRVYRAKVPKEATL